MSTPEQPVVRVSWQRRNGVLCLVRPTDRMEFRCPPKPNGNTPAAPATASPFSYGETRY